MEQDQIIQNLKKRLLIERIVFGAVILAVAVGWSVCHFKGAKSLILVDGKPVVCVCSASDAHNILNSIKSNVDDNCTDISFKQDVRVVRAPRSTLAVSRHKAFRTVAGIVSPVMPRWAIIVDGKPIVAVPSEEMAGEVLEAAKLRFGKQVSNLAEEPQFKENVTVSLTDVDPSIYKKSADEAVEFLFSANSQVSREGVYVVKKGDLAGSIAAKSGLKLAELAALNSGVNLNRLQIGDKLRVKTTAASPKLTVVVRDMSERVENIPAPVQTVSSSTMFQGKTYLISPGQAGKRKIVVESIYENGRLVGSETVDEQLIKTPTPKRIAMGIKPRR